MKTIGIISTAALSLLLGVAAPSYAQEQHDQQQEQKDKPAEKKASPSEIREARRENRSAAGQNAKQEEKSTQQQNMLNRTATEKRAATG